MRRFRTSNRGLSESEIEVIRMHFLLITEKQLKQLLVSLNLENAHVLDIIDFHWIIKYI